MATGDIDLNFINNSDDKDNSQILIYQKNVAENMGELSIAWQVINNCGIGDNHPFTYPMQFDVGVKDCNGNYSPLLNAINSEKFEMIRDDSGDVLKKSNTPASGPNEVEILNGLTKGAINTSIYKDGKLLATEENVVPGQKGVFEFHPRLYFAAVSGHVEGQSISYAILENNNAELDLFGIASADVVMTGAGSGCDAGPYKFELQNINYA